MNVSVGTAQDVERHLVLALLLWTVAEQLHIKWSEYTDDRRDVFV